MKKTIKTILIIIFFICFLGLFLRPQKAKADFKEDAYNAITTYRDFIVQGGQNAILSQFFTYNYLGLSETWKDGFVRNYRVNLVVTGVSYSSDSSYSYIRYLVGTGSYYYDSDDNYLVPHAISGGVTLQLKNGVAQQIVVFGNGFWLVDYSAVGYNPYRSVTYCDLTDSYYTNSNDGSTLQRINLFTLPSSSVGSISSPSPFDTFGDSVQSVIDTVAPSPVVTTVPPFSPPATVPPILPPAETVTALPALTDDSNNYYVDYSPYIDGNFYAPPATEDISLSPALSASGAIISEGFGWLTDSGIFSVLLVLMLVSFAIYNLI